MFGATPTAGAAALPAVRIPVVPRRARHSALAIGCARRRRRHSNPSRAHRRPHTSVTRKRLMKVVPVVAANFLLADAQNGTAVGHGAHHRRVQRLTAERSRVRTRTRTNSVGRGCGCHRLYFWRRTAGPPDTHAIRLVSRRNCFKPPFLARGRRGTPAVRPRARKVLPRWTRVGIRGSGGTHRTRNDKRNDADAPSAHGDNTTSLRAPECERGGVLSKTRRRERWGRNRGWREGERQ